MVSVFGNSQLKNSEFMNKSNLSNKQSQVSIFFIIGISLLLLLIVFLFIRADNRDVVETVVMPPELQPAADAIKLCMDKSVEETLFVLGSQSGYIDLTSEISSDPLSYMSMGEGALKIPYWYFDNSLRIPEYGLMEQQMTGYINTLFMECVDSLDFSDYGVKVDFQSKNSTTEAKINEKDVTVLIEYPVRITTLDGTMSKKAKQFHEKYNVRLRDMIELSKSILAYENNEYFLENLTINMMAMSGDIPFSGMEFRCGRLEWELAKIKSLVQETLRDTFREIRVEGTDYYPFEADENVYEEYTNYGSKIKEKMKKVKLQDNMDEPAGYEKAIESAISSVKKPVNPKPSDSYYYNHYFMEARDYIDEQIDADTLNVDFLYMPEYGMEMTASPSSDGILRSGEMEGASRYLSFMCINLYHFTYDITYPVIVRVTDQNAFAGEGYSFKFAFPVIIRNNKGLRSARSYSNIRSNPVMDHFCKDNEGRKAYVRAYDESKSSSIPLENVNISMICARKKCRMGATTKLGNDALLKTNITDSCGNPVLLAEKKGYMDKYYSVEDRDVLVNIDMKPLKEFDAKLIKHQFDIVKNTLNDGVSASDGEAVVYLDGIIGEGLYEETFIIEPGKDNKVELPVADSEYDITISYLRNDDYSGGFRGTWRIDGDDLDSGNTIEFHVAEMLLSTLEEDAAKAAGMVSSLESDELKPVIR